MMLLPVFGLYFILIGGGTIKHQQFDFDPLVTLTGDAAVIAGGANISTGIVILAGTLLRDPLPLIGIAALVLGAGVSAALVLAAECADTPARQRG